MDQKKEELVLADILRLFKGKLKLIVCLALIVGIIAASCVAFITYSNTPYSGSVVFYLSNSDDTRSILALLSSESFAEKLILEENGLPKKELCDPEDYQAAIDALEAYEAARQTRTDLYKQQALFNSEFAIYENKYKALDEEYKRIFDILSIYKGAMTDYVADESHLAETKKYEQLLDRAAAERNEYKIQTYDAKYAEKIELEHKIAQANRALKDTRNAYEEASGIILIKWRAIPENAELVKTIKDAISCEYLKKFDDVDNTKKNPENSSDYENSRFLSISVSIIEDEEFANTVISKLMLIAPDYLEKNLEKFTGASEPQCTLVSTFVSAEEAYETSPLTKIAVAGAVGAIATVAILIIVIVIIGLLPPDLSPKKKSKKNKSENSDSAN